MFRLVNLNPFAASGRKFSRKTGLLLFILLLIPHFAWAAPSEGERAYVQIKSARLMDQPKLWGKPVSTLAYGEEISIVGPGSAAGWFQVRSRGGKLGYLHQSALSTQKIVLRSGGSVSGGSDSSDVVLAGKGFNSDVERQFAASNSSANFRAVDQMEQIKTSPAELAQFVKQGRLAP